jgi:hypothetical protein
LRIGVVADPDQRAALGFGDDERSQYEYWAQRTAGCSESGPMRSHAALEDRSAPGLIAPELTADGDHPSIEGYRLLGLLVARELRVLGA